MHRGRRIIRNAHILLLGLLTGPLPAGKAQEQEQPNMMSTSGFVDFYYSKNLAQPASHANKFRNFDVSENQFDLALAELVFQKTAAPIGFRIDADFGSANDMVQGGTQSTLNYLQQAYVTALLPVGSGLTVDAGKFVTHMGFEVIESKDNWNYSRSLLFAWAIPYYHVGLRAAYPVFPALTVTGYLYNGWNNAHDNNSAKTFGASLLATPSEWLTLIAGWIGGEERVDSAGPGARHVFDLTILFRPTQTLTLAVNANYGTERMPSNIATWKGVALYARYHFSENTGIALRSEIYNDRDGHTTGIPHRMGEVTATIEQLAFTHLLLRAEYRHDWSSEAVFDNRDGVNVLRHQSTFALGTVITF
jgi:hypothetical protein